MQDDGGQGYRLSVQQEQRWLTAEGGAPVRAQCAIRISGPLDPARLWLAVDAVAARHEALRTTYRRLPGLRFPLQWVSEDLPALREEITGAAPADLEGILAHAGRQPLDPENGPVFGVTLARESPDNHVVVLTALEMTADVGSLASVAADLAAAYGGVAGEATAGEPAGPDDPDEEPLQYADFAEWQHEMSGSPDPEATRAREHWAAVAEAGSAVTHLPFEGPGAAGVTQRIGMALGADLLAAIETIASRYGTDAETVVEAGWHTVLGRLSGADEVVVATVVDGRHHEEQAGAVGAYSRALPVRCRIGDDPSFAEVIDRVARARADAIRYQDWLPREGDDLAHAFWTSPVGPAGDADAVAFTVEAVSVPSGPFRLGLGCGRPSGVLVADLHYDPSAFPRDAAERMASHVTVLLAQALEDPAATVSRLSLIDGHERARLLTALNDTTADFPVGACMHDLIEEQAGRTPDRRAVVSPERELTYSELNERANRLAHLLREHGVGPDAVVGLCMPRSAASLVALLGILKAGGAYLPLNLEHPPARLAHQLAEAGAIVLVTEEPVVDRLPEFAGPVVCLDRDEAILDAQSAADPERLATPDNMAYVVYTSGSTGTPKGVVVSHRSLVNYATFIGRQVAAGDEGMTFAMVSEISTDLGNTTVFTALTSGGSLHLVEHRVALDAALFAAHLAASPIDVLKITPSHLSALLSGPDPAAVLPRRWLFVGGEALPWDLLDRIRAAGACRVINHYGPTETCVGCTTFDTATDVSAWRPASVPIGRPIANAAIYVLDRHLEPVPVGVAGELFVGGIGVSAGYVGRPDATAAAFVADPFSGDSQARLYRTGDRARLLGDGSLEFLGRSDGQVKIRGYRVEPGEVEAVLRRHDNVGQAAVVVREDTPGDPRLVAYWVSNFVPPPPEVELRDLLSGFLPAYMVPTALVSLDALPLTPNGKLDRSALPAPEEAAAGGHGFVEPRNDTEATITVIWQELLGLAQVGVDTDFFELGGHSLLATQVIARLRNAFGVQLPVHSLFTSPTVEGLARLVTDARQAANDAEDANLAKLIEELEGLSDEEAERMLAAELGPSGEEER